MTGRLRAVVVDDNDPEQRRRVRLSIPELFHDPGTGKILSSPWCEPTGHGFSVPPVGSQVWVQPVWTSDGEILQFTYERGTVGADDDGTSHAPPTARGVDDESVRLKVSAPFNVPSPATALKKTNPRGKVRREANDAQLTLNLPTSANAATGPRNAVFKEGGFVVEIDGTPGAERLQIHHPTGAGLEVAASGSWTERAAKRYTEILEHDTARVGGDERRRVDGHVLRSDGGNRIERTGGRRFVSAQEVNIKSGSDVLIEADGPIRLRAKGVYEMRAFGDAAVNSGGQLALGGSSGVAIASALGDVNVTTVLPTSRVIVQATGGMDVRALPIPGAELLPAQPVALAPPLLAFIATLITHLEVLSASAAVAQPNPAALVSQQALADAALALGALMTAPYLRSTTGLGV